MTGNERSGPREQQRDAARSVTRYCDDDRRLIPLEQRAMSKSTSAGAGGAAGTEGKAGGVSAPRKVAAVRPCH